jgi:hypothetical protein
MNKLSLLFPDSDTNVRVLSKETMHDLGFDMIVSALSKKESERNIIFKMLSKLPSDPATIKFRADIFEDILTFPELRNELQTLLEKVDFLKTYGSFSKETDVQGVWDLMHRMEEMHDYIIAVEAIYNCLSNIDIKSEGLIRLRDYTKERYNDRGFKELKKDIEALRADTSNLKSVTLGVNLNQRFEAESMGLVSINSKPFTKSEVISNFTDFLSRKDDIQNTTDWNEKYQYRPMSQPADSTGLEKMAFLNMTHGLSLLVDGELGTNVMQYMDKVASHMVNRTVKNLKFIISRHINADIHEITDLIPEFMFYIRFEEFITRLKSIGCTFAKPEPILESGSVYDLKATGLYNLKLAIAAFDAKTDPKEIVTNEFYFDKDHMIYILTGANRGGKTTITQAVGISVLLAQHGIYVPADSFRFAPFDMVLTHFPADEDKTMDLGRLGEECQRFKDLYKEATEKSLLLLNESFSTTSYEEGYYIAFDAVKALRKKGIRTIYNTHMHKLGMELDGLNEGPGQGQVASLVSASKEGKRSYIVIVAPPEGTSYARDIAEKYGVTYDMLTEE